MPVTEPAGAVKMYVGILETVFFEGEHAAYKRLTSGMQSDMSETP
jgi:hypothetical protein